MLVRYKDEPGAGFGKHYVTATNAYEAIQMAKALYGKVLISEDANLVSSPPRTQVDQGGN